MVGIIEKGVLKQPVSKLYGIEEKLENVHDHVLEMENLSIDVAIIKVNQIEKSEVEKWGENSFNEFISRLSTKGNQ